MRLHFRQIHVQAHVKPTRQICRQRREALASRVPRVSIQIDGKAAVVPTPRPLEDDALVLPALGVSSELGVTYGEELRACVCPPWPDLFRRQPPADRLAFLQQ